jgi:hypothetical protein
MENKYSELRTLADGTRITREWSKITSIDGEGRTMVATTTQPTSEDESPFTTVEVTDLISATTALWDSRTKQAVVTKKPLKESGSAACQVPAAENTIAAREVPSNDPQEPASPSPNEARFPAVSAAAKVLTSREDLGVKKILGLEAHGMLVVRTVPAGMIGNDEPIVSTREKWWASSHNVGFTVRAIDDDPQTGKRTQDLVRLSFGAPNPATFQPPPGYRIVVDQMIEVRCGD